MRGLDRGRRARGRDGATRRGRRAGRNSGSATRKIPHTPHSLGGNIPLPRATTSCLPPLLSSPPPATAHYFRVELKDPSRARAKEEVQPEHGRGFV
ncbi:hypothetical protein EJB05_11552, partial [Eragrostis curvula]